MPPAPFEFEGVVRLTRYGAAYLVFTIVAGFAALNTGNNSLYIGLAFMLGALVLSGVTSKGGLKQLDVEMPDLEDVWVGQPASATLVVRNRSRLFTVRDLLLSHSALDRPLYLPLVARGSSVKVAAPLVFEKRGEAALEKINCYTRYPFGLFMKKRRIDIAARTIVYPRLLHDVLQEQRFASEDGDQGASHQLGAGDEVFAFREYVRGDSLRQIHWKKSASVGRWIIKQLEKDESKSFEAYLDTHLPAGRTDADFENLVSQATTYLKQLVDGGAEILLQIPGETVSTRGGESNRVLYETLAMVQADRTPALPLSVGASTILFSLRSRHELKSA